jgi:hypothetical protein
MASVAEIYPSRYLSAADLHGRAVTVTIERAALEELRNPRTHQTERKLVVYFAKARKCMPLNKTQARALAAFAGDESDNWPGVVVVLAPTNAPNGADTINIASAPTSQPRAATTAESQPAS